MKCPQCGLDLFELTDEDKHVIEWAFNALKLSNNEACNDYGERLEKVHAKIASVEEQKRH